MSPADIKTAIARFRRRLDDLENFNPQAVQDRSDPTIHALEVSIDEALTATFGHDTLDYNRYSAASNLDTAVVLIGEPIPPHEVIEGLIRGKERAIALLRQAIRSLEERLADLAEAEKVEHATDHTSISSSDVFIVHGHDDAAKTEVARLIERAGLNAVILHEKPHAGRTLIEKFEEHGGAAGFAIILLTPDDVGGPAPSGPLRPRARQNVVGEMFWFAGKLGRKRVCALKKGDIELPSDIVGIGYTDMDEGGAWKAKLLRELRTAGFEGLNWEKALA